MSDATDDEVKPTPDPTRLTTEAMSRLSNERAVLVDAQLAIRDVQIEAVSTASKARFALYESTVAGVKEVLSEQISGAFQQINERLNAMDKASTVLSENVNRVPTNLQTAMETAGKYNDVKFNALSEAMQVLRAELTSRFELLDKQTVREKAAADLAVTAAFAAADKAAAAAAAASTEAIRKSEAATAETIKTNEQARIAGNAALTDKIDDDRDRMNRLEQMVIGIQSERVGGRTSRDDSKSTLNIMIGVVGAIVAVVVLALSIYAATKA